MFTILKMATVGETVCRWLEVLLLYLFNDVLTTGLTAYSGNRRCYESPVADVDEDDSEEDATADLLPARQTKRTPVA